MTSIAIPPQRDSHDVHGDGHTESGNGGADRERSVRGGRGDASVPF